MAEKIGLRKGLDFKKCMFDFDLQSPHYIKDEYVAHICSPKAGEAVIVGSGLLSIPQAQLIQKDTISENQEKNF